MHWLEAVADIGKCSTDDDRHRVLEERALHFLLDLDGLDTWWRLFGWGGLWWGHSFVDLLKCRGTVRPSHWFE